MDIQHFSSYKLAIFQVESGLHITVIPNGTSIEKFVLTDSILKEKLTLIFREYIGRNPESQTLKAILQPTNNANTIYIAIIK